MKTIKDWYEELPPGYRELALLRANQYYEGQYLKTKCASIGISIGGSFNWGQTPESVKFWSKLSLFYQYNQGELPGIKVSSMREIIKYRNENKNNQGVV